MKKKHTGFTLLAVGLALLVFGLLNSGRAPGAAVGVGDNWRWKNVKRACGVAELEPMTKDLRTERVYHLYDFYQSDCKGTDQVVYYAYDITAVGVALAVAGGLVTYKTRKQK